MKSIKRNYFQNSITLLRRFPSSQNSVSKAVVMMKVSNVAGIVNLIVNHRSSLDGLRTSPLLSEYENDLARLTVVSTSRGRLPRVGNTARSGADSEVGKAVKSVVKESGVMTGGGRWGDVQNREAVVNCMNVMIIVSRLPEESQSFFCI